MKTEDDQSFIWRLFREAKEYKGIPTQGIDYYVFFVSTDYNGDYVEEFVGRIKMPDYTTHEQYKENHPRVQTIVARKLHAYCTLFDRDKKSLSIRRMQGYFPVVWQEVSNKTLEELGMK